MKLDISPLIKAIQRLEEGLVRYQANLEDEQLRDGLIKRFEFTYEMAHKMLKRYLESASATADEFDRADFQYLIRSANERALLLGDWPAWRTFREMRNRTSHTYNEKVAAEVVAGIPGFLEEARYLRDRLLENLS